MSLPGTSYPVLEPDEGRLAELIALSNRFGADPAFSRAGGGNASLKDGRVLWIKPSGVPLATLAREDLVPLDRSRLVALLEQEPAASGPDEDPVMTAAAEARLGYAGGRRPSVELLFHALLPEPFVLHTHPIMVNALTCSADGEALAARLLADRAVWVPYTDPGLPLARAIVEARRSHEARTGRPAPAITLLANHGVIVGGDSAAAIDREITWLTSAIETALAAAPAPAAWTAAADATKVGPVVIVVAPVLRALLAGSRRGVVVHDADPGAVSFTATAEGRAFVTGGPLIPDQIVYSGSWPLLLDLDGVHPESMPTVVEERLAAHRRERGRAPIVAVSPGIGLFAVGETWAEADTARHVYLDMLRVGAGAARLGGVRHLSDHERTFIEDWEAEAYRKGIAAGDDSGGRVAGRVALVTGAAQGFGLGIAEGLAAEGAIVVIADLNAPLAAANAARLEAEFGPGRAMAVPMDVTDEASVAAGIAAVVDRCGGLDIVVSNAGVLRAGGVTTQPVEEFDLVTRVNYRGYFLVVKHAAPVMARQHAANPAWLSDIIEVNSKSGLQGSQPQQRLRRVQVRRHRPHPVVRARARGRRDQGQRRLPRQLPRRAAVERPAERAVRPVPARGQGARRRHGRRRAPDAYEAKVPMGRGCTPADVLEAILYLVAQQYETGQALPVTGGQVMLS